MEEIRLIAMLIELAKAHPRVTAALVLWFMLSSGWKAQPKEKRDAWSKAYPRPIGIMRFFLEILPDIVGGGRVLLWQVWRGIAEREPQLTSSPDSPIKGEPRETIAPEPAAPDVSGPRSSGGFAERGVLKVIAGVAALALGVALLTGCPMPAPDGCVPFATRCSPSGIPETCSQSQRWSHAPPATPCAQRGPVVCCRTRSPWGRELHACTPQSECLPELASDAGTEVSDAQ